jgi:hypothetical protein
MFTHDVFMLLIYFCGVIFVFVYLVNVFNKEFIYMFNNIFTSQGLVIRNLAQILDISQHSKSRLEYDWCYRLRPGSNQKTVILRKGNYVLINMSGGDMFGISF